MPTATDLDTDFEVITENITFEPIQCDAAGGNLCEHQAHPANWIASVCTVQAFLCEKRREVLTRDKEVRCVPARNPLSHLHPVKDVRWTPIPGQEA